MIQQEGLTAQTNVAHVKIFISVKNGFAEDLQTSPLHEYIATPEYAVASG